MKSVFRFLLAALVLLLVAMVSALTAMRLAIHGNEVPVPSLLGLTMGEAEHAVMGLDLHVLIERQYYSPNVAEGKIMSQTPMPGTRVRHGWQVRVAQSLGPQRVAIPDVTGQSARAADLNIRRRGLDVGSVAFVPMPGSTADQVLAQSPPANANGVSVPRISLLVTVGVPAQTYVMPRFIGQPLGSVNLALLDAGFRVGNVTVSPTVEGSITPATPTQPPPQPSPASIIVSQNPAPGQRVSAGATITFEVR